MALRIAALVLAAGSSRRMGTSKQLLPLGNKTVIRHGVDTLIAAGIRDIVAVCGMEHDACTEALEGTGAVIVRNAAKDSQMADSLRIGLQALEDDICYSGILVCLSDHPLVRAETCRTIVDFHHKTPERIIIPLFHGRRGYPSLFPAEVISDIFFTTSLRDVVREDEKRVLLIDVPDEGVILDMDSDEDYRRIVDKYARRATGHI